MEECLYVDGFGVVEEVDVEVNFAGQVSHWIVVLVSGGVEGKIAGNVLRI